MTTISGFCLIVVTISIISASVQVNAISNDIMSCVLCETVSESLLETKPANPASALVTMYRRCTQMGLMKPVCDHVVDDNARHILRMSLAGMSPKGICRELKLCDH
ncbi:hypothetical protein FO519_000736 [Halicephalobus sp. NKZ332]|nr:hypothetical protein FO519_000736 [Halicephalobus sp. NKZ332]